MVGMVVLTVDFGRSNLSPVCCRCSCGHRGGCTPIDCYGGGDGGSAAHAANGHAIQNVEERLGKAEEVAKVVEAEVDEVAGKLHNLERQLVLLFIRKRPSLEGKGPCLTKL